MLKSFIGILIVIVFTVLYFKDSPKIPIEVPLEKIYKIYNLKPTDYHLIESKNFIYDNKNITDYLLEGTFENGDNFQAYIQASSDPKDEVGFQYKSRGINHCFGNFYNSKYDFCSE